MIGLALKAGPWALLATTLIGGGWWIAATVADRERLVIEVADQAATLRAYDEALAEAKAHHQAVVEALARAHDQTARLVADRAAILEDLRHATAPDCPVPRAVRDAVDRLWPPAE